MKLSLHHRQHQPSASFVALVRQQVESLREELQIDEAHVLVERRPEASPAFRITAHLVTPGPDVFAEAVDHTLRAALQKTVAQLQTRIGHRHEKRASRLKNQFKTAKPGKIASLNKGAMNPRP